MNINFVGNNTSKNRMHNYIMGQDAAARYSEEKCLFKGNLRLCCQQRYRTKIVCNEQKSTKVGTWSDTLHLFTEW